jgi:VanZ family protein
MKSESFSALFAGWLPALSFLALLSWLSLLPGDEIFIPGFWNSDKLAHFGAYVIAGFLLQCRSGFTGYLSQQSFFQKAPVSAGLLLGAGHGVLNEVQQLWVPLREFSYWDMAANVTGCLTGLAVAAAVMNRKLRRYGNSS